MPSTPMKQYSATLVTSCNYLLDLTSLSLTLHGNKKPLIE